MKNKRRFAHKGMTAILATMMTVTPVLGALPTDKAYAETVEGLDGALTYEAEEGVLQAAIVDSQHAGYTGTGFVDYKPNTPGGTIEWKVQIPAAGEYVLEFRYANGGTENRPAAIKWDGTRIGELAFEPTGEWTNWKKASFKAVLGAGQHVLIAEGIGSSGGANIDHVRIYPPGTDPSTQEPAPTELTAVSMEELVSGVLLKKLRTDGLLASDADIQPDRPISRMEFFARVNRAMGFHAQSTFKNVDPEETIWGQDKDRWFAYVLEAAKQAGYTSLYPNGEVQPDETITRQEAAIIISSVLKLKGGSSSASSAKDTEGLPENSRGAIGAVLAGRYMEAKGGNFGAGTPVTVNEAEEIAAKIALNKDKPVSEVEIVRAEAVSPKHIAVVLNGQFDQFDVKSLTLRASGEKWSGLNPKLVDLKPARAAVGKNRFGDTVVIYEVREALQEGRLVTQATQASFTGNVEQAKQQAEYLMSWQMDHGGWTKSMEKQYARLWDGMEKRSTQLGPNGEELGSIDNNATTTQLRQLAQVYQATGDERIKASILKGIGFLLTMQYPSGGWPQVYPKRGVEGDSVYYSNFVTFNDNAMIKVMELLDEMANSTYPFGGDLVNEELRSKIKASVNQGVDYILKSQIQVDGKLAAWCAQHDPVTYEPRHARIYEHPSVSGSESVGIIKYLMGRPEQTPDIRRAVLGALQWLDEVKLEGIRYVSADPNGQYFVQDPSAVTWYRFYEIGTNLPIFAGRDGVIKRDIREIDEERRNGYSWGGGYARALLDVAKTTGYYENRIYVQAAPGMKDTYGRSVSTNTYTRVEDETKMLQAIPNRLIVSQDGQGDYATVSKAIEAVPENNTEPVEIYIRNGIYKEVITVPANKPFISLVGESMDNTVLTYDNYSGKEKPTGGTYGTTGSSSIFLYGNDFSARNLTMENSFSEGSVDTNGRQAVAVYARGERMSFHKVRFLGNQDTLYAHSGSQYYYQCYIEGDVDFIFGGARAVFDDSDIVSLNRGSSTNNGYITAASTQITQPYGFLIINSRLKSDAPAGTVYLGRPWHPGGDPNAIGQVVVRDSELGAHIGGAGWTDMSGFKAADARFYEYKNTGPGALVTPTRPQLTDAQAQEYTIEKVLNGWKPTF
jgi:PelA/Pel-15E family pectate lyase